MTVDARMQQVKTASAGDDLLHCAVLPQCCTIHPDDAWMLLSDDEDGPCPRVLARAVCGTEVVLGDVGYDMDDPRACPACHVELTTGA